MKKSLLFVAIAAASVSAMAQSPREYARFFEPSAALENAKFMAAEAHEMMIDRAGTVVAGAPVMTADADGRVYEALYKRPAGAFYVGISPEFYASSASSYLRMTAAPYVTLDYKNVSGVATKSWSYGIGDMSVAGGTIYTSEDQDLSVYYPISWSSMPVLTTTDNKFYTIAGLTATDETTGEVSYPSALGTVPYVSGTGGGQTIYFGLSSLPFEANFRITGQDSGGNTFYWFSPKIGDYGVSGIATVFPKPAVPYIVESVFMPMTGLSFTNAEAAELKVNVYSWDEATKTKVELIGEGIATANDVTELSPATSKNSSISMVDFKFYETNRLGVKTQVLLTVPSAIYVELTDFVNNPNYTFESLYMHYPYMDNNEPTSPETEDVGFFTYAETGEALGISADFFSGMSYITAPEFYLNAYTGNVAFEQAQVTVPAEGGVVSVKAESPYNFVSSDGQTQYIGLYEDLPDWLQVGGENRAADSEDDPYNITINVQAAALPAGETGRTGFVQLTTAGGGLGILTVVQGDGGASVEGVAAAATKAAVVGGDFAVSSSKATAVDVYSVSGQKVASATFSGAATIPASDLAGGVYILRFNDNTVVKVVK